MTVYLNELAPWERKNEYFSHIQLGKDLRSQTAILQEAIERNIRAQVASASAIIASQETIAEGIDILSLGIERVNEGLEGLCATFEWGISEVVWQLEQNREVLRNILDVLMAPLDTQAKERRRRAEKAFSNGWIDEAEEEFLESEKLNKYDFTVHISLGIIYLFHKIDKRKALEYFEKAIKYATPESNYYTSYALLYKALIKYDLGDLEEAERCTAQAAQLSPNLLEALYHNALFNTLLGNKDRAISLLKDLLRKDYLYCLKIDNEKHFDPIRDSLHAWYKGRIELRNKEMLPVLDSIRAIVTEVANMKEELETLCDDPNTRNRIEESTETAKSQIDRISRMIEVNSLLDSIAAGGLLHNKLLPELKEYLKTFSSIIDKAKHNIEKNYEKPIKTANEKLNKSSLPSWLFGMSMIGIFTSTVLVFIFSSRVLMNIFQFNAILRFFIALVLTLTGLIIGIRLGIKITDILDELWQKPSARNLHQLLHERYRKINPLNKLDERISKLRSQLDNLTAQGSRN